MKDFIQLLKLPPSILAAIALGTGLILFLPQYILQKLGLERIPDIWRTIMGASFVISTSILIIYFLIKIFRSTIMRFYKLRFRLNFPKLKVKK